MHCHFDFERKKINIKYSFCLDSLTDGYICVWAPAYKLSVLSGRTPSQPSYTLARHNNILINSLKVTKVHWLCFCRWCFCYIPTILLLLDFFFNHLTYLEVPKYNRNFTLFYPLIGCNCFRFK